jgi:hypothetical protein
MAPTNVQPGQRRHPNACSREAVEQIRALKAQEVSRGFGLPYPSGFQAIHRPPVAEWETLSAEEAPRNHATSFPATALSFAAVPSASTSSKV